MKYSIDRKRTGFIIFAAIVAVASAYFGQPLVHENEQAINFLVTFFSILAGFMVAIITIVGDPVLLPSGTWRTAEMNRDKLENRLIRHKWLFILYLITLTLVFFSMLLNKNCPQITIWLERGFLFFGVFALILSMSLPGSLIKIQRERIEIEIEIRKEKEDI